MTTQRRLIKSGYKLQSSLVKSFLKESHVHKCLRCAKFNIDRHFSKVYFIDESLFSAWIVRTLSFNGIHSLQCTVKQHPIKVNVWV